MTMENQETREFDVVIAGGGLAGLCLARQLRLNHPEWSVLVTDRLCRPLPEAEFKVGESSIEVGAYYFAQVLRLRDHMEGMQLEKFGLRYFYGGGHIPLAQRGEYGLADNLPAKSYQISRGKLENYLRELVVADGAVLEEGFTVDEIEIATAGALHEVTYRRLSDGLVKKARCRWVVDAMGRRRFLQKKFDLRKPGRGTYNAAWFRIEGVLAVESLAAEGETEWHRRVNLSRWYSTTHLMGPGYWVWLIPLADDKTSVGIVALEDVQPFAEYDTYDKAMDWLERNEPELAKVLPGYEVLDFKKFHGYSYSSKQVFSADRWACVGEAGVFVDPYYSVGSNMIAFGNSFVQRMIELDRRGEDLRPFVDYANQYYLSLSDTLAHTIQSAYPFFDNGRVMVLKTIWDYFIGWGLSDPQFYTGVFLDPKVSGVISTLISPVVVAQTRILQLFADWARATAGADDGVEFVDYFADVPTLRHLFVSNLPPASADLSVLVKRIREGVDRTEELAQVLFMLAVEDVLPEKAHLFSHRPWLNIEGISLNSERWEADGLFQPKTRPRPLAPLDAEMRSLFRYAAKV